MHIASNDQQSGSQSSTTTFVSQYKPCNCYGTQDFYTVKQLSDVTGIPVSTIEELIDIGLTGYSEVREFILLTKEDVLDLLKYWHVYPFGR